MSVVSRRNLLAERGSCLQRTPPRETASYKVTGDLLLAEYPWQRSTLILHTSAPGVPREGGRE